VQLVNTFTKETTCFLSLNIIIHVIFISAWS